MKVQPANVSTANQSTSFKRGLVYSGIVGAALLPSLFGGVVAPKINGCLAEEGKAILRPEGQLQGPVLWYLDRLFLEQPNGKQ